MPSKGPYTVEIIDAKTGLPFKEHPGRNGMDGYIEAEPGLDYFIRFQNNSTLVTLWEKKVDGIKSNYNYPMQPGESYNDGLWSYNSRTRTSTNEALSFQILAVNPRTMQDKDSDRNNKVGVIEIDIYENIYTDGYYHMNDLKNNFEGTSKVNATHAQEMKKFLKSETGSVKSDEVDLGKRRNYRFGTKLQSFKIKYCSTLGLIVDGVLPKSPTWDYFKMIKPQAVIPSPELEVEPIIFTNETRDGDGNVVETKTYEMFDLTNLEDMDESF